MRPLRRSRGGTVAEATPPDLFGYGARSTGLAMTGVSYADDYEAVFANPAGLAAAMTLRVPLEVKTAWSRSWIDA